MIKQSEQKMHMKLENFHPSQKIISKTLRRIYFLYLLILFLFKGSWSFSVGFTVSF